MEGASSAIKKLESDFDVVFGPDEFEMSVRYGQPRQISGMYQMNALIQFANLANYAQEEERSDFLANGVSRAMILSRVLAGRKLLRNMFTEGL